jgi:hypothetical protein
MLLPWPPARVDTRVGQGAGSLNYRMTQPLYYRIAFMCIRHLSPSAYREHLPGDSYK